MDLSREAAEALDAADPLARFRERFVIDDPQLLYLDGNSLGRLPLGTRERLAEATAQWASQLVAGWAEWIDAPERAAAAIAPLIGARPHEVICCDSVTVNLYKLAMAAHRGGALVTDAGNFPTDRYVLEGIAAERGCEHRLFDGELPLDGAGLVVLSHVDYRTGEIADMPGITARCREAGVPLIWDLCHSAGAIEVDLAAGGAQMAVGCTYKYLNAGPGAPAFLYLADGVELRTPIQGWFGQRGQFAMEPHYDPEPGIRRFLAGTPPILGLAAVEEGARLIAEAGIARLRAKSVAQTELLIAIADACGFEVASPRNAAVRGSHVALRHDDAWRVNVALIEAGVIPDFRGPDLIRMGVAAIYTRYVDVWDAMDRMRALVERGDHLRVDPQHARVT